MKKFYGILILAILCLLAVSPLAILANASQGNSWPMFHGDLAHTGYTSDSGPTTNHTLWIFTTNDRIWSSPAVSNGVVYIASFDHNVYAVSAKDGTQIWKFSTGGTIYCSPAVSNNLVYIGSDDHKIYALKLTFCL